MCDGAASAVRKRARHPTPDASPVTSSAPPPASRSGVSPDCQDVEDGRDLEPLKATGAGVPDILTGRAAVQPGKLDQNSSLVKGREVGPEVAARGDAPSVANSRDTAAESPALELEQEKTMDEARWWERRRMLDAQQGIDPSSTAAA